MAPISRRRPVEGSAAVFVGSWTACAPPRATTAPRDGAAAPSVSPRFALVDASAAGAKNQRIRRAAVGTAGRVAPRRRGRRETSCRRTRLRRWQRYSAPSRPPPTMSPCGRAPSLSPPRPAAAASHDDSSSSSSSFALPPAVASLHPLPPPPPSSSSGGAGSCLDAGRLLSNLILQQQQQQHQNSIEGNVNTAPPPFAPPSLCHPFDPRPLRLDELFESSTGSSGNNAWAGTGSGAAALR